MKKIFLIIITFLATLSLVACGGEKSKTEKPKSLIVYTNQTTGGRDAKLKSMVKAAGFDFDVLFVEIAGQNLKNRLLAEKEAPIADVVLGGGELEHLDLKENGVLHEYAPTWLSKVDNEYKDSHNFYSPWAIEPLYLVYNKKHYASGDNLGGKQKAPESYEDLANNFQGKYNIFKPSSGTGATIYASILSKYRDDNGEYGVSDAGWNLLKKLINGGEMDAGLWQMNLAGDKKPISMTWAGAILEIEDAFDVQIGIVRPEGGVPVVVSQVAIVESKHEGRIKASMEFIEWWGKTETQIEWAKTSGQAPANKAALDALDERIKEISNAEKMELDWEFIVKNISNWRQKIELDLIG